MIVYSETRMAWHAVIVGCCVKGWFRYINFHRVEIIFVFNLFVNYLSVCVCCVECVLCVDVVGRCCVFV